MVKGVRYGTIRHLVRSRTIRYRNLWYALVCLFLYGTRYALVCLYKKVGWVGTVTLKRQKSLCIRTLTLILSIISISSSSVRTLGHSIWLLCLPRTRSMRVDFGTPNLALAFLTVMTFLLTASTAYSKSSLEYFLARFDGIFAFSSETRP
jgi:hypothetical protein